jgi:site-specific DNA recombinase
LNKFIRTLPFLSTIPHSKKFATGPFYQHIYQPIIAKELFDSCQAVLKGWHKKPFKWGGKEYIFRGLITCANTGRVVSTETKKRTDSEGNTYEVNYLGVWNPDNLKQKVYVKEDDLLKEVEQVFKAMQIEPELLTKVVQYIKSSAVGERD